MTAAPGTVEGPPEPALAQHPSVQDTPGQRPAALKAEGLAGGPGLLIHNLHLSLEPGERVALIGPNGSGKSTLLRLLARQLRPRGGVTFLHGANLARLGRRESARSLGLLPQAPALPEGVTVRELVSRGRYPHRGPFASPDAEDQTLVAQALEDTGLSHLEGRDVAGLSGGERQRAWIAMALAQQPRVLLLDEPTTYLDLAHAHEALNLLCGLVAGRGMTLLMVLHDLQQASRFATRVLALQAGQIVAQGPPAEVITPDFLRRVYGLSARVLPDPQTGTLLIVPT